MDFFSSSNLHPSPKLNINLLKFLLSKNYFRLIIQKSQSFIHQTFPDGLPEAQGPSASHLASVLGKRIQWCLSEEIHKLKCWTQDANVKQTSEWYILSPG